MHKRLLGDHQCQSRVGNDVAQPLGGIFQGKRSIGPPRLENRQHCHHKFHRAFEQNTDIVPRPDTSFDEMKGKVVGAAVEIGIRRRLLQAHDRNVIGRLLHLRLKHLMNAYAALFPSASALEPTGQP